MSDEASTASATGPSDAASAQAAMADRAAQAQAVVAQRPEVAVGAAFAGAFLLAKLVKRLGR